MRASLLTAYFSLWLILAAVPAAAQNRTDRESKQYELYQQARQILQDRLSLSPTDPNATDIAALGEFALMQLGRPGDPEATDPRDRGSSGLYELAGNFSRNLANVLTSDTGRWIGTNDEAILVFLSLDRDTVFYAGTQLNARAKRLERASAILNEYDAAALGRFNIEANEAAKQVLEDSAWVLLQETKLEERSATIKSFERSVPRDVDVSGLPTLREAIDHYIGSIAARERAVEESARERERREALERRRDIAATDERERIDIELRRIRDLGRLSQTILERDYDLKELGLEQEISDREGDIARQINDLKREKTELELELASRDEQIQVLQDQIDVLSAKTAIREMPAEIRGLLRLLTAPGTWKPERLGHRRLRGDASYGIDPQPHSLDALTGAGALDEGFEGVYALYVVMANDKTDRPKYGGSWLIGYSGGRDPSWEGVDIEAEIHRDRALYDRVKKVHDALREWGDELVAQKILMP